jgi:hypothetical protein
LGIRDDSMMNISRNNVMKKSTILLSHLKLKPSQIHKLRGFVGNLFKDEDLIHNHNTGTGRLIYRYPLIQFKLINNTPAIIAITEKAVSAFMRIFMKLEQIRIDDEIIPIYEKDLKMEDAVFGFSERPKMYEFYSPWIGLNQKNYSRYINANQRGKSEILRKALIGNILAMSKGVGYWLEQDRVIEVDLLVRECPVTLKGRTMKGFKGSFQANFIIPDHFGIGKSVSRGFGAIRGQYD